MTFDRALARLARLTDEDLDAPWPFAGEQADRRYALYHALESEQRAVVTAPPTTTESAAILALAQAAFGDLRGLLAGLDDVLLDRAPAAGEWTVRETLAHAIGTERSYRANTAHALTRSAGEPLQLPAERRPAADPRDTAGGVLEILAAFAIRRAETDIAFAGLSEPELDRPSLWGGFEVDVRHRLHRFASHIAEHTIQCAKIVAALGAAGGDARAICRRIGVSRGLHERRSDAARLSALDDALLEKAPTPAS
ncbi:MAG TPA: DinB family protein [Candidatus Limnocylindria bacterium]|nr:DinB family protein [Candidatus Limnocylindria bacterium]